MSKTVLQSGPRTTGINSADSSARTVAVARVVPLEARVDFGATRGHCTVYAPRGPEYERDGTSDPLWYLYDGHGSVVGTVEDDGTIVSTRKYDVYGAVRGSTGPSGTRHKYVGGLKSISSNEWTEH